MEIIAIIAGLAVVGIYLYVQSTTATPLAKVLAATGAPAAAGVGVVTVGGQPAGAAWNPNSSTLSSVGSDISLANQGLGAASTVAKSTGQSLGSLSSAIPVVGVLAGVATSVISIISAHHKAALANEGKVLNTTDPTALNDLVLVAQAAVAGEITSVQQAQNLTSQIVSDWYLQVKSIQKGMWPYTLSTTQDPSILAGVGIGGAGNPAPGEQNWFGKGISGDTMPSVCNASCVVGHYFIERDAAIVNMTVAAILAGEHGTMTFPALPPHDTQSGVPEIQMAY